jgi:hypothetical protein
MRFRLSILVVVAAAISISVATAAPTKGKPPKTGAGCRPNVAVVLKGNVASAYDASAHSFGMNVMHSNRHGRAFKKASQPLSIMTSDATKVVKGGASAQLSDLAVGDKVLVKAKACKAELKNDATPQLLAMRVVARSPKPSTP